MYDESVKPSKLNGKTFIPNSILALAGSIAYFFVIESCPLKLLAKSDVVLLICNKLAAVPPLPNCGWFDSV